MPAGGRREVRIKHDESLMPSPVPEDLLGSCPRSRRRDRARKEDGLTYFLREAGGPAIAGEYGLVPGVAIEEVILCIAGYMFREFASDSSPYGRQKSLLRSRRKFEPNIEENVVQQVDDGLTRRRIQEEADP